MWPVIVHRCNGPAVTKLQKIRVQSGCRGASGKVMAEKTKRQFHLYLDHNTLNLCNPCSELMF